jgi:two-component system chemotaxis response regulator CheY
MAYSILIVDDSPAMCAMIGRILDLSGLEIAERRYAHDGEDALAQLQAHPADLVLTDINMPRMDGEEFMRRLGTDSALGSVPVVVVSTDGTAIRRRRMPLPRDRRNDVTVRAPERGRDGEDSCN